MYPAERSVVREGIVAGLIGAAVVAVWFFVFDLLRGRPFLTPTLLGSLVFFGVKTPTGLDPALGPILGYTVLHGLAWGVRGPLMMAVRADYFGRRSFATIEGFASIVTTLGLVTGPLLAGFIADRVGDYRPGFLVLACVTALGGISFAAARRPRNLTAVVTGLD